MSDIKPALTAEEWAAVPAGPAGHYPIGWTFSEGELHRLMALANAALPDGDPHKLTRRHVWTLQLEADIAFNQASAALESADFAAGLGLEDKREKDAAYASLRRHDGENLRALADAIASILPPEGT